MIRKDYTTTQMLKQYTPPNKSIVRYRPDGIPFTTLPWEATTFMRCYVIKEQSRMYVYVRIVKADEKDFNPYWSTEKTEFDRVIYTKWAMKISLTLECKGRILLTVLNRRR